jgi:hypothetical protein
MMSDLKDSVMGNVSGDMGIFRKLLSKIPGFQGYVDSTVRRDSDKVLRDLIANRVRELENRISSLQREFISHGEITYIDDLEAAAIKLRTFGDRVRTAPRGYSSLFSSVKIKEEELTRLYEYDAALLDSTDAVSRAIDNVQSSVGTDGLPAAIRNLEGTSRECVEAYDRRQEVVTSM